MNTHFTDAPEQIIEDDLNEEAWEVVYDLLVSAQLQTLTADTIKARLQAN